VSSVDTTRIFSLSHAITFARKLIATGRNAGTGPTSQTNHLVPPNKAIRCVEQRGGSNESLEGGISVSERVDRFATSVDATERYHVSTLKWVYPISNGDFVIGFDVDPTACTSPQDTNEVHIRRSGTVGATAEGVQKMYAAALTAFALGVPSVSCSTIHGQLLRESDDDQQVKL